MSKLPKGWVESSLIDLAKFIDYRGRTPKKTEEGIPLITAKNIKDGFINREPREFIAEADYDGWMTRGIPIVGDVLLTTEAPLGNVAQIDIKEKFALAQRAICFQFYKNEVERFVYYYLRSPLFNQKLGLNSTGSTVKGIKAATLKKLPVHIAPLTEQKRIVEKLDEVLAQVDTIKARLDGIPDLLKRFRQSVLAAAVSGKLTETSSSIWLEGELSDVATFQNGYAFKSGWFSDEGDFQVIKLGNVKDDYLKLDTAPAYLNSKQAQEYLKFKPSVGDILLSMTGTKFKRDYGFACLVERDLPVLINQRVGRILPERKKVIPEYLHLYLRSELFRNQFFAGETGGVNQGNVGSKHIMSCKLSIPSMETQNLIASKARNLFDLANTIEAQVKKAQVRVDNLTQSILAKAFRGELVPQDPNDEPADKLLERIAEARKEAEALAKAAKKAENAKKRAAKKAAENN
ncbi:restriction endonuclease subunit S [Vibrio sp. 10N]|uniref:restriction endonuclease subunit S n=1 Tax=Vibrio sp. 10N TaxID=3058938 RepID=UPI002813DE7E|nr:type I restriction-modification system specificity subunit [Vibrio sp. 10N]